MAALLSANAFHRYRVFTHKNLFVSFCNAIQTRPHLTKVDGVLFFLRIKPFNLEFNHRYNDFKLKSLY